MIRHAEIVGEKRSHFGLAVVMWRGTAAAHADVRFPDNHRTFNHARPVGRLRQKYEHRCGLAFTSQRVRIRTHDCLRAASPLIARCLAGPKLTKTVEAAVYTTLAYANDSSTIPLGASQADAQLAGHSSDSESPLQQCFSRAWLLADNYLVIPLIGGGQVLVAWINNSTTAVLAWRAADNVTADMTGSSLQMTTTGFLDNAFANATVNNATLNPFQQALQGSPNSEEDLATVRTTLSRISTKHRDLSSNGHHEKRTCISWAGAY